VITKTGGKFVNKYILSGDAPTDITSNQVIDYMKNKHGVDPQVIPGPDNSGIPSSATADPTGKKRGQMQKIVSSIKAGSPLPNPEADALQQQLGQRTKGDIIFLEDTHFNKNPHVAAHEVGHTVLHKKPLVGRLLQAARSRVGSFVAPAIAAAGTMADSPALAAVGAGVSAARQGAILYDEAKASALANEAMKDLGYAGKSKALRKALLLSYLPTTSAEPALLAAQAFRLFKHKKRMGR